MAGPLHIPVIRRGKVYRSLDVSPLVDPRDGSLVAEISIANTDLIERDARVFHSNQTNPYRLEIEECQAIAHGAADAFLEGELELYPDGPVHGPQEYRDHLCCTTGLTQAHVHTQSERLANAIRTVTESIQQQAGGAVRKQVASGLAVILPNNAPGVNGLWLPALGLGVPVAIKPGHSDPWTPLRILSAWRSAGLSDGLMSYYPSTHAGVNMLLNSWPRGLLFGDGATVQPYRSRPDVDVRGPGRSKLIFGSDTISNWSDHMDLMVSSVLYNGGRSCICASTIVVPSHGEAIAQALAERLVEVGPSDGETLAACVEPGLAKRLNQYVDEAVRNDGVTDCSSELRGSPRWVVHDGLEYLLPTVVLCRDTSQSIAQTELPFPLVSVVEVAPDQIVDWLEPGLVATVVSDDANFVAGLRQSGKISTMHQGPIPTTEIRWDSPPEGNLVDHLCSQTGS